MGNSGIIKDRTFFFGAWQSSREQSQAPQIASVPTAAEQQGIFPSRVNDPLAGAPFPNNTIPKNRWDPVSAGLAPLYPFPDLSGIANNFFSNPREVLKADHTQEHQDISGARLFDQYGIKGTLDTPKIKGLPDFSQGVNRTPRTITHIIVNR